MTINSSFIEVVSKEEHNKEVTPYMMFKYAIKTELTRKYYERRLKRFLDFIEFGTNENDIEARCNVFAEKAKNDSNKCSNQRIADDVPMNVISKIQMKSVLLQYLQIQVYLY